MDENQDRSQNQETPAPGPSIPQMTTVEPQPSPKTSTMAVVSLVLGILAFCTAGITGIFGLVLGIIALVQISRVPGSLKGTGLAVAGVITSAIGIFTMPIMAAILFPIFAKAREEARITNCLGNVKKISVAMLMYSTDYDDHFPAVGKWNDAVTDYNVAVTGLRCPSDKTPGPSYAMNKLLSGASISNIVSPMNVPSVYDSIPGVNQAGGPELLPSPPRHLGSRYVIGFADGHVLAVNQSEEMKLLWDPGKQAQP
ncbi:MAG: DUF4190 domain-containing protein [Armatimonadota bacterium]